MNSILGFAFYYVLLNAFVGWLVHVENMHGMTQKRNLQVTFFGLKNPQNSQGSNLLLLMLREMQPASVNCQSF